MSIDGLPDNTDIPDHSRDHDAVADLINSRADIRLATMIGVGYLEKYLGTLLRIHLRDIPEPAKDYLLEKKLRRVSERIDLAGKLGVIEESVCRDLHTLCDIRNRFAHHVSAHDTRDPVIAEKVGQLHNMNDAIAESKAFMAKGITDDNRLRLMIAATARTLHDLIEKPFKK